MLGRGSFETVQGLEGKRMSAKQTGAESASSGLCSGLTARVPAFLVFFLARPETDSEHREPPEGGTGATRQRRGAECRRRDGRKREKESKARSENRRGQTPDVQDGATG